MPGGVSAVGHRRWRHRAGFRRRYRLAQVRDGVDGVPLPMKPNDVEPEAGSDPLCETFVTVAVEPLVLSVPFQIWLMVWPLGRVHCTVQPLIAELPAVTVTSPWKPPDQEPMVR